METGFGAGRDRRDRIEAGASGDRAGARASGASHRMRGRAAAACLAALPILLAGVAHADPYFLRHRPDLPPRPDLGRPPDALLPFAANLSTSSPYDARDSAATPPALPQLEVGRVNGRPGFRVAGTGEPFRPRGYTFIRVADFAPPVVHYPPADFRALYGNMSNSLAHPDFHDGAEIEEEFALMAAGGYNVVRLMLESSYNTPETVPPGERFAPAFLDAAVDLLRRARARGLRVLLSPDWLPVTYDDVVAAPCLESPPDPRYATATIDISGTPFDACTLAGAEGYNAMFLHRGIVEADGRFVADLLDELDARDPDALAGLMGVELWNEPFFAAYELPFSQVSGSLEFEIDGSLRSYDMTTGTPAGLAARQRLADDATRNWLEGVLAIVRSRHPEVLLSLPVFTPYGTGRSGYRGVTLLENAIDPRQPLRVSVIEASSLDFLDVHAYPVPVWSNPYSLEAEMATCEIPPGERSKPAIFGEFGAMRGYHADVAVALDVVRNQMAGSCAYGFGGWVVFAWDDFPGGWNAVDEAGAMLGGLSPYVLEAPCPNAVGDGWNLYD